MLKDVLKITERKKKAIAHFNVSSFEQFKAVAEAARELNAPILVGVSEGERSFFDINLLKSLVDGYNRKYGGDKFDSFQIFLNADHTRKENLAKEAAFLGCDEVLFDASDKSIEKNIKLTREMVKVLKKINSAVLVEGEIGYIGSSSLVWDKIPKGVSLDNLTNPKEAKRFVLETGVDLLAPAVGNVHGMSKSGKNPRLNIDLIKEIKRITQIPLVLHGGSGISEKDIFLAVKSGINIVHISTEIRVLWKKTLEVSLKENVLEIAPYKILTPVFEKMKKFARKKIDLIYS